MGNEFFDLQDLVQCAFRGKENSRDLPMKSGAKSTGDLLQSNAVGGVITGMASVAAERLKYFASQSRKEGGKILSQPMELIAVQRSGNVHYRVAVADTQGRRRAHEDSHFVALQDGDGAFGVLDGHGGDEAAIEGAELLKENLLTSTVESGKGLPGAQSLRKIFERVDDELSTRRVQSGSTVIAAIAHRNDAGDYDMKMLNCGDSRGVLVLRRQNRQGVLNILSTSDHKPDAPKERRRIEASGGFVKMEKYQDIKIARLDGNLAVSRGLGDFKYKNDSSKKPAEQKVSCIPEIYTSKGIKEGDFCVMCCDGIWDVMSVKEVVSFVSDRLEEKDADLGDIAANLIRKCLGKESQDNMTVMILEFGDGRASATSQDEMQDYEKFLHYTYTDTHVQMAYQKFLQSKGFAYPIQPCGACRRWHHKAAACPFCRQVPASKSGMVDVSL